MYYIKFTKLWACKNEVVYSMSNGIVYWNTVACLFSWALYCYNCIIVCLAHIHLHVLLCCVMLQDGPKCSLMGLLDIYGFEIFGTNRFVYLYFIWNRDYISWAFVGHVEVWKFTSRTSHTKDIKNVTSFFLAYHSVIWKQMKLRSCVLVLYIGHVEETDGLKKRLTIFIFHSPLFYEHYRQMGLINKYLSYYINCCSVKKECGIVFGFICICLFLFSCPMA